MAIRANQQTVELKTINGEVVAKVLRNENVESFKLKKEYYTESEDILKKYLIHMYS